MFALPSFLAMTNTYNSLCILVYYPAGAGGKFFINSIGLSRHCVPHDVVHAEWDIKQHNFDLHYYNTKLQQVLATIPAIDDYLQWQPYELGVGNKWYDNESVYIKKIIDAGRKFCILAHDPDRFKQCLNNNPQCIIKLTNYGSWMKAAKFKNIFLSNDIENKISYWSYMDKQELKEFDFPYLLIDIDAIMFDKNAMTTQIKNLYSELKFDDFNSELWGQYYDKYINFHKAIYEIQNNQT